MLKEGTQHTAWAPNARQSIWWVLQSLFQTQETGALVLKGLAQRHRGSLVSELSLEPGPGIQPYDLSRICTLIQQVPHTHPQPPADDTQHEVPFASKHSIPALASLGCGSEQLS